MIDYDVNTGGGESYTWQGATFTLAPGDYTFVYIPLQDAESTLCPAGTSGCGPTQDWVPMDEVIRSLSVTLTQGDIDGDANQNGILDVNEVAVGAASGGPTVVDQGSSTVIAYVAASGGVIQIIQRTSTTTMWNNMSDGTIDGLHTMAPVALDPFEGRIDQIASAKDTVGALIKGLEFDGVQGIGNRHSYNNGMKGNTKGVSAGHKATNDEGLILGAGIASAATTLKNGKDVGKANTRVAQLSIGRSLEQADIELSVTHARTDYSMERTIGDFSNTASTKGQDTSVSLEYVGKTKVAPILGYTAGKSVIDGYTEAGSVQSARTVAKEREYYKFGTVGAQTEIGIFDVKALHHTDNTNQAVIGINKELENGGNIGINVIKTKTKLGTTNAITAGFNIKF